MAGKPCKGAMKALVPQAAFDSLAKSGKVVPSQTLFAIAAKGVAQKKEQGAAR